MWVFPRPTQALPNASGKSRCKRPGCRLRTMLMRFGSGLPRLSNVLRPMMTTLPEVNCLNHLKSSGRCHGILLPAPITRFSDIAAMALKCFICESGFFVLRREPNLELILAFLQQEHLCVAALRDFV